MTGAPPTDGNLSEGQLKARIEDWRHAAEAFKAERDGFERAVMHAMTALEADRFGEAWLALSSALKGRQDG